MKTLKLPAVWLGSIISILFTSCSRNEPFSTDDSVNYKPPLISVSNPKLKKMSQIFPGTADSDICFSSATYDNSGKILSYVGEFGKVTYQYFDDKIIRKEIGGAFTYVFKLSNNKIIEGRGDKNSAYFTYNNSNQLSEYYIDTPDNDFTVKYTWDEGNLIHIEDYYQKSSDSYSYIDIQYTNYICPNGLGCVMSDYILFYLFCDPYFYIDPILLAEGFYGNSIPQTSLYLEVKHPERIKRAVKDFQLNGR